ncbi:unnamed protein product [Calypogeia fissa]
MIFVCFRAVHRSALKDSLTPTEIWCPTCLLRAVVEGRGVQHALRMVRKMEASGSQPDVYSLTALLDGYCQQLDLNEAEDILQYMERGGRDQRPNCCSYNILLKACAAVQTIKLNPRL